MRVSLYREQLARGRGDQLPGRTFSAPRKWMKGKGRITIQYGVCYSYANPPVRVPLCAMCMIEWYTDVQTRRASPTT